MTDQDRTLTEAEYRAWVEWKLDRLRNVFDSVLADVMPGTDLHWEWAPVTQQGAPGGA